MSEHINENGKFQSDKYEWCRPDFVPLKVTDPMAQPVLWAYAQARRSVDASFADDLERRLRECGYDAPARFDLAAVWRAYEAAATNAAPAHLDPQRPLGERCECDPCRIVSEDAGMRAAAQYVVAWWAMSRAEPPPTPERVRMYPDGGFAGGTFEAPKVADIKRCVEHLKAVQVQPDDSGVYTFLMFASEADRKAYEEALRARGETLPKGTVLTP